AVLAIEFVLLFFALPALFAYTRHRIPAIPALWVLLAYCLFILLRDPQFDRHCLWDTTPLPHYAPEILGLFALAGVIGSVLVLWFAPDLFLELPRSNPLPWALVMVLYPVVSVYPQGIIYRAFIFDRYRALFGAGWPLVLASAFAFAYVHIIFRNNLALGLTLLAGFLFATRYAQTKSIFVSSFEHALYGCAIFTIGLGRSFFFFAATRRVGGV